MRPHLYRLDVQPEPAVVSAERCFEVDERMSPYGVVEALDMASVERVAEELLRLEVEAVAVCLLFSFLDPSHERRVAELLRARLPHAFVVASHEVAAEVREYERASTTAIDAALGPPTARYLRRLREVAAEAGLPIPLVMLSSGGVTTIDRAAAHPAGMLLSGPAGGAVATRLVAALGGHLPTIGFDMGGTSCDTFFLSSPSDAGLTTQREVAGLPVRMPMVDIHTVSAGGGSVAWSDPGGALRVGPRSAGSLPGPASYGRGGTEATVTDANVVLGYLPADSPISDDLRLDVEAATAALERLAREVGYESAVEAAEGVYDVAVNALVQAIRVVSVEQGQDPAAATLTAFGGAGPLHACAVAEQLGIARVLCLPASGVLSALGLAAADQRTDVSRSVMRPLDGAEPDRLWDEIRLLAGTTDDAELHGAADVRYRGQSFELTVPVGPSDGAREVGEHFHAEHARRYGHATHDAELELVTLRAAVVRSGPAVALAAANGAQLAERRERIVRLRGSDVRAQVHAGDGLVQGTTVTGPAVVEFRETTCLVLDGWTGTVDAHGVLLLERQA
jgi:N-methylhydantoinase A